LEREREREREREKGKEGKKRKGRGQTKREKRKGTRENKVEQVLCEWSVSDEERETRGERHEERDTRKEKQTNKQTNKVLTRNISFHIKRMHVSSINSSTKFKQLDRELG
jgi:hypothetical protein